MKSKEETKEKELKNTHPPKKAIALIAFDKCNKQDDFNVYDNEKDSVLYLKQEGIFWENQDKSYNKIKELNNTVDFTVLYPEFIWAYY